MSLVFRCEKKRLPCAPLLSRLLLWLLLRLLLLWLLLLWLLLRLLIRRLSLLLRLSLLHLLGLLRLLRLLHLLWLPLLSAILLLRLRQRRRLRLLRPDLLLLGSLLLYLLRMWLRSQRRIADSLGIAQIGLHRGHYDARLDGYELDAQHRYARPGVDHDAFVEDAVDQLQQHTVGATSACGVVLLALGWRIRTARHLVLTFLGVLVNLARMLRGNPSPRSMRCPDSTSAIAGRHAPTRFNIWDVSARFMPTAISTRHIAQEHGVVCGAGCAS